MRPLNRPDPLLPAAQMKTYAIDAPRATHWRAATCDEAGCLAYRNGWRLKQQDLTDADLATVKASGRRYRTLHQSEHTTYLIFEAGQPCFRAATHRVRLDRPELFVVSGGDWRGDPLHVGTFEHTTPDSWVDDFATHQDKIATTHQRG